MTPPVTDAVLGKRYRLQDRIAGGGMGEVWRAHDEILGRGVAVKILRQEYAEDPTFLARFRAEARHSAALSHPGIAAVYDFGESTEEAPGSPFLVMEYVPGEPLSALIAREGALVPDRTLDIVGQAAFALQAAHDSGLIHRDVKPGNILVTPSGEVKITDFGIARATDSVPLTQTGAIMGTAYYVSPEQAVGGAITPSSDIYSLGIVAYECLTGGRPFDGDTPVSVVLAQVREQPPALSDTVPAPVRSLVMGMLAKEPDDRPPAAGVVGQEARSLRDMLGPEATDGSAPLAATRTLHPVAAGAAGASAYAGDLPPTAVVPAAGARRADDTDPSFALPVAGGRGWVPYAVALLLFALLLLTLRACDSSGNDATVGTVGAGASTSAAEPTAPATVQVVAEDYLGLPPGEARQELEDLGLRVALEETEGGGEVGTVKAVAPTGTVAVDTLVRLEVVSAVRVEDEDDDDEDESRGRGEKPTKDKTRGNGKRKDD